MTHNGATFQATRDTAKAPGVGEDWRCLAGARRDGRDGASLTPRGAFGTKDSYRACDIVEHAGASYVARCDNPRGLPGEGAGWQLMAALGAKGTAGPRGHKGADGNAEPR